MRASASDAAAFMPRKSARRLQSARVAQARVMPRSLRLLYDADYATITPLCCRAIDYFHLLYYATLPIFICHAAIRLITLLMLISLPTPPDAAISSMFELSPPPYAAP